jgi:DNA primase
MNIKDVVESYGIELQKQGKLYVGFCPFHDDKNTPNLYVYEETQSWFCYACNHGGDAIKFIALIEGKDYNEIKKRYIHDYAQDNLSHVGEDKTHLPNFKEDTFIRTASICRDFLQRNRDAFPQIAHILKKLDEKLSSVDYIKKTESNTLVEKFKNYIYSIRR